MAEARIIIEHSVSETIPLNRNTVLVGPVEKLEELLYWEKRLAKLDIDYVIVQWIKAPIALQGYGIHISRKNKELLFEQPYECKLTREREIHD